MEVLLIGPPGAGKGTQGVRIAERFGVRHISVGDLLRAEVAARTEVGCKARAAIGRGELVSDDLIIELIIPAVMAAYDEGGFVLDGFPRTVAQAIEAKGLFNRFLAERREARESASAVVYLEVPRHLLLERLLRRAELERRQDDTPDVIANRLSVFEEATHPLVDHFRDLGRLRIVDATGDLDDVSKRVFHALGYAD
jgi:adenylate kinase